MVSAISKWGVTTALLKTEDFRWSVTFPNGCYHCFTQDIEDFRWSVTFPNGCYHCFTQDIEDFRWSVTFPNGCYHRFTQDIEDFRWSVTFPNGCYHRFTQDIEYFLRKFNDHLKSSNGNFEACIKLCTIFYFFYKPNLQFYNNLRINWFFILYFHICDDCS